ncbi:hypothetical protein FHS26_005412 [Rhizobium pisi]|uniref:Transposase n=1 Tax=Rhizobium pisi TaxID=574561 RepID=A0A7W5BR69_9HYPH|nr:hypothetical protein [Rhizobium pisi]MBB4343195.1 hypothetical protein [Rhizobium leguminosarum]MBB5261057.1 hypothetical protein [Rhizobium leguminosarum]MBB6296273.1 hypothetical protein [Rhizobium leguminosarum]MDH6202748.1 hypothetical protein [Rhizobium leguminosarum]
MKTSRFSEPQILAILRQAEGGVPVPELCREHGMSTASFYKWRWRWCTDVELKGWGSLKRLIMAWLPCGGRLSGVRKQACG